VKYIKSFLSVFNKDDPDVGHEKSICT